MVNALFATDCSMATLKQFEEESMSVSLMEYDMKGLTDANLSHCVQKWVKVKELLPAFIPMPSLSFADMDRLPNDEIYEKLSAYDPKQLSWCLPESKN